MAIGVRLARPVADWRRSVMPSDPASGTLGARVTAGVAEVVAGSGIYAADVDESADPVGILWDTGAGGATVYAAEDFDAAAIWAAAPAPTPLEDFAVAVRDVDNTSPAPGSLGEAVNDGAGGGGGGATPAEVWRIPRGASRTRPDSRWARPAWTRSRPRHPRGSHQHSLNY